jgi:hypothetical protein
MLNNGQGYSGFFDLTAFGSGYNAQAFMVKSILSKISTATICKVVAVTNSGGVAGSGFVDVQPLVNMVDGSGNAFLHGVVYHCAYCRVQGGTNAIIIDPKVGDIGLVVFADRDISSAVRNKAQSNPGSGRMYDMADGLYVFSIVTGAPTQYIEFNAAGITITSPVAVTVNAPTATVNAATTTVNGADISLNGSASVQVTTPTFTVHGATVLAGTISQTGGGTSSFTGNMSTSGSITSQGTVLHTHTHGGVTTGGGNTGAPN